MHWEALGRLNVSTAVLDANWRLICGDVNNSKGPTALKLLGELQRRARIRCFRLALAQCRDPLKCYVDGTPIPFFGRVRWGGKGWIMRKEYSVIEQGGPI